jgi:stringent starvation protein B
MIRAAMTGSLPNKKTVLEQLLTEGMVLVALDARLPEVDVPTHLGQDPQLRLNLSHRFGLPMAVQEWGVRATLTFAGVPYSCCFPWRAVFLMVSHVSGQPYLFPDDIPAELLSQAPRLTSVGEAVEQLPLAPGQKKVLGPSQGPGRTARPQPRLTLVGTSPDASMDAATGIGTGTEAAGATADGAPANSRRVHRILPGIASAKRRERRPDSSAADGPGSSVEAPAEPAAAPKAESPQAPTAPAKVGPPLPTESQQEPSPQQPRRRGHLRLVKS